MNDTVADTETPAAETTPQPGPGGTENDSQQPSDNGTANSSEGLLSGAESETAPDFTPDPSQAADPSKAPAPVERPPEVGEQFWDPVKGEVRTESLAKSYNELRKQNNKLMQEKGGEAPENAEDYLKNWQPPHRARAGTGEKEGAVMDRFGELDAKDPMFAAVAKFAKKGNMSPADFTDGMQELLEDIHPLLAVPFNAQKEMELLGEGAETLVKTNKAWVDRLATRGVVNEKQYELMLKFGGTAEGVLLTNALRIDSGEKPIPVNASVATGRKTPDECSAMLADPRYNEDGPIGDAYRAECEKAFAETYGTEPA